MAQEQNKKLNLSSAKTGMEKDTHPSQLTEAQYTHAYNANIENESGNSLNLTNEKSNILASKFKQGFKVIGFENDIDSNSTFFFLVNPTTHVGEFGVIEDNQNTNDISDVLVDCDNCNKVNQLADPLETLTQLPLQTYTTLLTDADGFFDVDLALCMPFVPGSGFNFDINYPIKKIVIKNEKCGKNIYFSDNNNPPRHINITELIDGKYHDQNVPCDVNLITPCINYNELRIFKLFNIPKIEPASIELGGRLQMGVYEFLIAYSDAAGNEISPYYSITNPISIFDKNNRILEQKDLASRTNLAIRLEVSDLDRTYSHYKVAVIQTADIEGASRYFIEGLHTINDNTVVYTTEQNKVATSFDKLLIDQLNVEKVEGLTASNNILFQYGVTQKKEINLQPVINLLGEFAQWQTHMAPESLYENGVLSSKFLGYNRDEVVPLSIRFLLDGGYETALFPLISRFAIPGEKDLVVDQSGVGINDDVDSIIKNIQSCNSVNRNQKWQFYNTAFSESGSICEGVNIQTVDVTESLTKTCIIEGVYNVAQDMFSIDIEETEYIGLAQYIEDNKLNCPNAFEGTDICTAINGNYTAVSCETDIFEGLLCDTPTLETELVVGDIVNEVATKIEKVFPSEYLRIKMPKTCTIYKTDSTTGTPQQDPTNPLGFTPGTLVPNTWNNEVAPVRLRDSDFENEDCNYPVKITTYTNTGDNYNEASFNNYYISSIVNDLYTSKIPHISGISGNFTNKIHKGALWFKGEIGTKTRFLLDISKDKAITAQDTVGQSTQLRVSIFKSCSDTTAIYSKIVTVANGMTFLLEKDTSIAPNGLKITDSLGVVAPIITNGWLTSKKYYVAVDCPIVSRTIDTDISWFNTNNTLVYISMPTTSCYTVTQRDIEYSRVDVTWDSIRFDKKIIATATCTFQQPVVQSCNAVPYRKGEFAYWESEETYPDNPELYDSRDLVIPQNLIPIDIRTKFEDIFVDAVANGSYILNNNANFTCANIRHFKFPDNDLAPFMSNKQQSPFGSSLIFPLGITIDENLISAFLDIAVVNGLLTQSDRSKISGYEVFRGDISLDRGVVASGLLYDMRKYKEHTKTVYYSNYPFNSYQNDLLNLEEDQSTENGVTFGLSNRNYTFHSPETDYYRQGLPSELSVQGYMFGNSRGHFDEVQGHPKWVILSDAARSLANFLATIEVAGEILIKVAEITSNAQVWGMGGFVVGLSMGLPAFISAGLVAIFGTAEALIYKHAQYRYQWLKIFRDFGSPQNFAYYYYADGYYNYMLDPGLDGNKLRGLHIAKYLNDGRFVTTNEVTGERLNVNNIDRERSVLLSFGDMPITYPSASINNYKIYDKGADASITYQSASGFGGAGRSPEIVRNIASPYVAIKNYLPTQYGTISSIKWLSTGYVGDLRNATSGCLPIFGGDTYISRHTLKRKMPLFLVTAMKQADLTPYNYFFYSNIGRNPQFYCSYEQNKDFSNAGSNFPDIDSDYIFDNLTSAGNYIISPSKFYLYYYGITNFLSETRINTNYRYAGKESNRKFYPLVGDLGDWTQEETVSIREPNIFLYNSEYSKQISLTRKRTLTDTYEKAFNNCTQDMPNGIIASLPDNTENSLYDPWLIYRPLDIFEFPSNYGKLKDIIDIEGQSILARFANTSVLYNKVDSKVDDGSSPVMSLLGGNSFFQRRSTSFHNTKLGYGGTQNFTFVSNEFGHFFADAKRGQVVMVPSNGEGMVEISSSAGDKASGMRNWFKEHLPFKMLNYLPNVDIDNPYNGLGLTMGWDSRYRRVFLTKKDYIPKNPCIEYIEGQGFVYNVTKCCDPETTTDCPPGYTYNEETSMCDKLVRVPATCPLPIIIATNDIGTPVVSVSGGTALANVLVNDTLDGLPVVSTQVTTTTVSSTNPGVTLVGNSVVVAPGTLPGSYTLTYRICEVANPSNCDTANVNILVNNAVILANDDIGTPLTSIAGGTAFTNVLINDTLNGVAISSGQVITSFISSTNPGITLVGNSVVVAPGTLPGSYVLTYRICETANPTNCDIGTVSVLVNSVPIVANDNIGVPLTVAAGGTSVLNVLVNDTLNGSPVTGSQVITSFVSSTNPGVTLLGNSVLVAAGTPPGSYTLTYGICETANPTNCDTAVATVVVNSAPIVASDETGINITDTIGGTTFTNVLTNDTLNGAAVIPANVTVSFVSSTDTGITLSGNDVVVSAGVPIGQHSLTYQVCENLNLTNCDTATVSFQVLAEVCTLAIGDNHQGGIIFYLDSSGCHGLVVTEFDLPTIGVPGLTAGLGMTTFSPTVPLPYPLPTTFGSGLANTNLLFSTFGYTTSTTSTDYAAQLCVDYAGGGYTDWYLPSADELYKVWQNMAVIGNFALDGDTRRSHYWTSSRVPSSTLAYNIQFYDYNTTPAGSLRPQQPNGQGGNGSRVRAIRNF